MWFYAQYGRDVVIHIAFDVLDGGNDPDVWYEETGNSIHVLWLLYCRDSGFGQHELENVYWMQTAAASEMVFGFAGDINFAENWYTTEYMKEQPDGLWDCFSEDLLAQMQGVDVMIMNNEFTYVNKKRGNISLRQSVYISCRPAESRIIGNIWNRHSDTGE